MSRDRGCSVPLRSRPRLLLLRALRWFMPALAFPPGRRGLLSSFAPEAFALLAHTCWVLVVFIWHDGDNLWSLAQSGAMLAYALIGLGLVMVPVNAAAGSLASEKTRMTGDALVLTPGRHWKLALCRYLFVLWPGLRLLLYLLPVYVVMAFSGLFADPPGYEWWMGPLCAFLPKPVLAVALALVGQEGFLSGGPPELTIRGPLIALCRAANDLTVLLLVSSVGFYVSARARSAARSLIGGYLAALLLLVVVMPIGFWVVLVFAVLANVGWWNPGVGDDEIFAVYIAIASGALLLRLVLSAVLPLIVAWRFDRMMTGTR